MILFIKTSTIKYCLLISSLISKGMCLLFFWCLFAVNCSSQNYAMNWYFGQKAGLTFNTYPPTILDDGVIAQREGNATISDEKGKLLFYTDGRTVWNHKHVKMKNGSGLNGQWYAAQSSIIAKQPNSESIYFIFTVSDWQNDKGSLSYSTVDMAKNQGLGEVIIKNIVLNTNVREQISAVYADEELNVWILAHEKENNKFVAYKLTEKGMSPNSVISEIGMEYNGHNRYGQLKFSCRGTHVCSTLGGSQKNTVQLFKFDQETGVVSETITISNSDILHAYSSEFSPNGKVLYITSFNGSHLYQYDLSSGIESIIQNSKTNLSTTGDKKSCLQIGYDHKIYVSKDKQNNIGVINYPNIVGKDCQFEPEKIKMSFKSTCRLGFPNFIQSYFKFYHNIAEGTIEKNVEEVSENLVQEVSLKSEIFNIYFETGSSKLSLKSIQTLNEIIQRLNSNPEYKVILSSHTDCRGDASSNLKLSKKRAEISAEYLNKKLKKTISEGVGYGETKPTQKCNCNDCSEEQNAQNRRTEITLVPLLK